jgi:hypothetical protein
MKVLSLTGIRCYHGSKDQTLLCWIKLYWFGTVIRKHYVHPCNGCTGGLGIKSLEKQGKTNSEKDVKTIIIYCPWAGNEADTVIGCRGCL